MKSILLVIALFLGGCASLGLGPRFEAKNSYDKKKALVYIYRVNKFAGSAGNPYICIDNQVVGEMTNGGYLPLEISPGSHKVELKSMGANAGELSFSVIANNTYYLRADYSLNNGAKEGLEPGVRAGLAGVPKTGGATMGAVAGGMTAAAGVIFFGDKKEAQRIMNYHDQRAHKNVINPGFLMVKEDLGKPEILDTKLIKVPVYKTNPCASKVKTTLQ